MKDIIKNFKLPKGVILYLPEKPDNGTVIIVGYPERETAEKYAKDKDNVYKIVVPEGKKVGLIFTCDPLKRYEELAVEVDIRDAMDCKGFHLI